MKKYDSYMLGKKCFFVIQDELVFYGLTVGNNFEVQINFESNPKPDQVIRKNSFSLSN
jgi:hypothetical protein